jgi:hypothetical protein
VTYIAAACGQRLRQPRWPDWRGRLKECRDQNQRFEKVEIFGLENAVYLALKVAGSPTHRKEGALSEKDCNLQALIISNSSI